MGYVSDQLSIQAAIWVPGGCFAIVALFGWSEARGAKERFPRIAANRRLPGSEKSGPARLLGRVRKRESEPSRKASSEWPQARSLG